MQPKRCPKTGKILSETTGKKQKGGMFAPGAFANMGQAMLNPRGAAAFVMPVPVQTPRQIAPQTPAELQELNQPPRSKLKRTRKQSGGAIRDPKTGQFLPQNTD